MADINIEKKSSKKPVWPWILGALLLIGVIWAIAEMGDDEEQVAGVAVVEESYDQEPAVTDPQANVIEEQPAEDFVSYVEDQEIKDQMGVDHVVTGSALAKLSESIRNLAKNEERYSEQITNLEQTASEIQSDPQSLQHADKLKDAFTKASALLQDIQQDRFPELQSQVAEVQQAATEFDGSGQLLDQKEKVKSFFEETAQAVEEMKGETTATF